MNNLLKVPTFDNFLGELENIFFNSLDHYSKFNSGVLPYNILYDSKNKTATIEVACAGYNPANIEVTINDGTLDVKGETPEVGKDISFLHQGISRKKFHLQFPIARPYLVKEATFKDGMLRIVFEKDTTLKQQVKVEVK